MQSRTEISFYDDDAEACVQTNLPLPKQNEVYYWEAKLHDKPETTLISVGLATKPYPSFRLPGTSTVLGNADDRMEQTFNSVYVTWTETIQSALQSITSTDLTSSISVIP